MSSKERRRQRFFDRYLSGEVAAEQIDDFIDAWHEHPADREIFEYLGMSKDEYALWLRDPDALPRIAQARREHSRPKARREA